MSEKINAGCERPQASVISTEKKIEKEIIIEKDERSMIRIGKAAPDFAAPAYLNGEFVQVKLSDYLGKWVVLCCYPSDFTFV